MTNFIQVSILFVVIFIISLIIRNTIMIPVIDKYDNKKYLAKYFIIEVIYLALSWAALVWGIIYTYGYFILKDEKCISLGIYFPICAIIIGGTFLLMIKSALKDDVKKENEEK